MRVDVSDLRPTIVPKSDQLNAEQLLGGPITVTVTEVSIGSDDQPVVLHYEGDNGRPFKPGKTCRKILIFAWGKDGRDWVGKSMTLYNDPAVKFGGAEVGGIRISHLSDIRSELHVSLTATKGKKSPHVVKVLAAKPPAKRMTDKEAADKIAEQVNAGDAAGAALDLSTLDKARLDVLWDLLEADVQALLSEAWPKVA